jgi:Trypsin-like peptidase domain
MRKLYFIYFLFISALLLQSCAAYYFPQKIKVSSPEKNAQIYVNGQPTSEVYPTIISKRQKLVLTSFKSGYRMKSQFVRPSKFNFGVAVDFSLALLTVGTEDVGLGIGFFGGVAALDYLIAGKRQPRKITMEPMEKLYENDQPGIFIFAHENLSSISISQYEYFKYGNARKFEAMAPTSGYVLERGIEFDVQDWMDTKLDQMKFQQNRADFILPYRNTIKLDVEILELNQYIYKYVYNNMKAKFRFKLCDSFGNELFAIEEEGTSQVFYVMGAFEQSDCFKDALYDAMIKMMKSDAFKEGCNDFQRLYDEKNAQDASITMAKPLISNPSYEEMVDAQVSIDMNDDSHGSGCLISPEGHILASHRIVGKADTVDVVFSNGARKKATVIRRDAVSNVVLLKTDTLGNAALMLEKEMSANVGEEVLAVGSPVSMSLAQTLTSGIISSKHKVNELDYFQTDVRISRGGNGSPLVNKKGLLIGIVNEKYVEPGVEGISFAVSSADILKRLKLTYSN